VVHFMAEAGFLSFPLSRSALGSTHPVGTGGGIDHSPPSSAEVKNGRAIPPLPYKPPLTLCERESGLVRALY
jgi:hypothetical protein